MSLSTRLAVAGVGIAALVGVACSSAVRPSPAAYSVTPPVAQSPAATPSPTPPPPPPTPPPAPAYLSTNSFPDYQFHDFNVWVQPDESGFRAVHQKASQSVPDTDIYCDANGEPLRMMMSGQQVYPAGIHVPRQFDGAYQLAKLTCEHVLQEIHAFNHPAPPSLPPPFNAPQRV